MASLHISKVAVGCDSLDALVRRQEERAQGGLVAIRTRFRPRRSAELIGGSIFWIIKHRIAARQRIVGFDEDADDRRTIIQLDARMVPVRARPKRAHQGWRYLAAEEAPPDLDCEPGEDPDVLPAHLAEQLLILALI